MDAEHVERVVIAERALHRGDEEEAHHACHRAKNERAHRAGVTGSRSDRHETSDDTGGQAKQARLALEQPLDEEPRDACRRGCDEGVGHGEHGAGVGFESRSGVEAEPADPQQRGANHGERQRVGRHRFLAEADAAAKQKRADHARDPALI